MVARPDDFSFPSGHTAASFAAVAALMFAGEKKLWIPALVLAVFIAFSRLYLYVHYPTDILGGIAVGIFAGYAGYWIVKQLWKKKKSCNSRKEEIKRKARTAADYFALAGFILIMNNLILGMFTQVFHLSVYPAKLLTECILFIFSWLVQKFVIFRKEKNSEAHSFRDRKVEVCQSGNTIMRIFMGGKVKA